MATRKRTASDAKPAPRRRKSKAADAETPASAAPADDGETAAGDESDAQDAAVREPAEGEIVEGEIADVEDVAVGADDDIEIAAQVQDAIPIEPGERAVGRFDPYAAYLAEIRKHPVLSAEEQNRLAVQYVKTGDVAAAARLVTSNLRLVVKIAYEYRRAYRNLMDLIQEGNIGLMQAVKRYDPYRGVKLSSYSAWWIRAYILRFILNNWRLVKLGTTQAQRKLFFNLNKEKQKLLSMGVNPTSAEIARRLDVTESEVSEMDRRLAGSDLSLDAPVGDGDGRAISHIDLLPSGDARQDDTASSEELSAMVRTRLDTFAKTLKGKDITIFHERIVAEDPVTLQEIGDRYGISRERVRQLETRVQDKLRAYLKSELGDAIQFG